jgi:hypothetical protein
MHAELNKAFGDRLPYWTEMVLGASGDSSRAARSRRGRGCLPISVEVMRRAAVASERMAAERYANLKSAFVLCRLRRLVDSMLELVTVRLWRIRILSSGAITIACAAVVFLRFEFGHLGSPVI